MKKSLIQDLSLNTFQLVLNQVLGFGIFYMLSVGLDKNSFGQINLALAILLATFNIASMGIDQLIIKKIAGGGDTPKLLSIYLLHVIVAGLFFYGLIFAGYYIFPGRHDLYIIVLVIGIGKLTIFFSTPFKQAATGLEKFRLLACMLIVSSIIKCSGLTFLWINEQLSVHNIIIVFVIGDVTEFIICLYLFNRFIRIKPTLQWALSDYKHLLFESFPQTGVVLITSALARFDWIFIGFILAATKLAEYSFAYKIFEISTLPLLAVAPLLIPKFTRIFKQDDVPVTALRNLFQAEMIIAAFTILIINIGWNPIIDWVTAGKYGAVNVQTIFILSLCIPLLYTNNFFWTIFFARGKLKMILVSFIITLIVNVGADIVLIPVLKNNGAAIAFFAACLVQTLYFLYKNTISQLNYVWQPLIICVACALLSSFVTKILIHNVWIMLTLSIGLYILLLFATRQITTCRPGNKSFLNL